MNRPVLVRWGRSPYEVDVALAGEQRRLEALGLDCRYLPQGAPVAGIAEAQVLVVTSLTAVGPEELDAAPACRLLVTTTSGTDHLDLEAAQARDIAVARLPLARRDAVVESALGMALALLRDLPRLRDDAREGRWARAELPTRGIANLRQEPVGVVGLGVIGRRMAEVLQALGVEVWGADPAGLPEGVRPASVDTMVGSCRVVTLHCAWERGAPPVLGRGDLAMARPDLLVVNTARGGVLDLPAAVAALERGQLGGLGLDVFPEEPWPGLAALARHPRVLLTPHGAGYHDRLGEAIAEELVSVVAAWVRGLEIPNRVA